MLNATLKNLVMDDGTMSIFAFILDLQSARGDSSETDAATSGIYETVRSEVRRAISEIQNDLESVCFFFCC